MKPVRDIILREVIDDLWGAGYTILPRNRHVDPFFVPPEIVPQGRSYQWWHLVHDKFHFERPAKANPSGWAPVPASRHDGYFMPAGFVGDIEVNGLGLFEKSKFEVDREHAVNAAAAHKQVSDWAERTGTQFSGDVSVGGNRTEIGATKTVEDTTAIPKDMVPYIAQIFAERDYLGTQYAKESDDSSFSTPALADINDKMSAAMRASPDAPKWPTLNGILLPIAIKNVRSRIKQEASNGD